MKTPGPDHPITIEPAPQRWRVRAGGHVIADSADALILREADYPPRIYFPREDVEMAFLSRTQKQTHCPYKGDASYYSLFLDGELREDVVWSYEAPFPAMEAIAHRVSFYPDKVEVYEVDDARREPRDVSVDEAVQHTDDGSGASQREHWAAEDVRRADGDGGLR